MRSIILLLFFICPIISAYAQKQYFSITGKTLRKEYIVPNHANSFFLPHAYIQIKEMPKQGWLSDIGGYFQIDSLQRGKYHFKFSYVGFEALDTTIIVNRDIQNLQITLSDFSVATPQLHLILSKEEENEVLQSFFWDKYKLHPAWSVKEFLQSKVQLINLSGYCVSLIRNQIVFDYLDKEYGYNWRFEVPKGVIGLDKTLDSCKIFTE